MCPPAFSSRLPYVLVSNSALREKLSSSSSSSASELSPTKPEKSLLSTMTSSKSRPFAASEKKNVVVSPVPEEEKEDDDHPLVGQIHIRICVEKLRQRDRLEKIQRVKQRQRQRELQQRTAAANHKKVTTTAAAGATSVNRTNPVSADSLSSSDDVSHTTSARTEASPETTKRTSSSSTSSTTSITTEQLLRHIQRLENQLRDKTEECNRLQETLRVQQSLLSSTTPPPSPSTCGGISPVLSFLPTTRQAPLFGSPPCNPCMDFLHSMTHNHHHHHHQEEHRHLHQCTTTTRTSTTTTLHHDNIKSGLEQTTCTTTVTKEEQEEEFAKTCTSSMQENRQVVTMHQVPPVNREQKTPWNEMSEWNRASSFPRSFSFVPHSCRGFLGSWQPVRVAASLPHFYYYNSSPNQYPYLRPATAASYVHRHSSSTIQSWWWSHCYGGLWDLVVASHLATATTANP